MHRVVYIAGCWRSGSTLVGDVIGSLPNTFHVGELHHIWSRGLERNWLCGCGAAFQQCQFWQQVLEASQIQEHLDSFSANNPAAISPAKRLDYPELLSSLVREIFATAARGIMVDSSKVFRQGSAYLSVADVELRVVHVLRDPRATVYSLVHRAKPRGDVPEGAKMIQLDAQQAVELWKQDNLAAEQLGQWASNRYLRIRYEDFVEDPQVTLRSLAQFTADTDRGVAPMFDAPGSRRRPHEPYDFR